MSVYHDRLIVEDHRQLPFGGTITATVDTAGNMAVTRGASLGRMAAGGALFGPFGLLMGTNAKVHHHSNEQLYLLVEAENWAYTRSWWPQQGEVLRRFAQTISLTARQYERAVAPKGATLSASESDRPARQLRELAQLRDDGLLTESEFADQKANLLERMKQRAD